MTIPTAIPVNGDGTFDDPTWGESGGPFSVPADEANGIGSVVLPSNTVNYNWQHQGRWLRALRDRMILSDDGLFTTCLVKAGSWNTGSATLDGTLGPSRMIIDASNNGGVMVEVSIPAGSPHTFTASRDTYVNVNEAGEIEYQAVTLGGAPPSPTAGYVAVWKVVTDGTELASVVVLVPTLPTFASIRIAGTAAFGNNVDVAGNLDVAGTSTLDGDVTAGGDLAVTGTSTLGGAVTCSTTLAVTGASTFTGTLTASNNSVLGSDSGDTCTINAEVTANQLATFNNSVVIGDAADKALTVNATSTFAGAVECNGNVFFNGNTTIGDAGADTCTVNAATTFNAATVIAGASGGSLSSDPTAVFQWNGEAQFNGRLRVLTGTATAEGDLSKDASGNLRWRDATANRFAHTTAAGWVKGHGQADAVGVGATVTLDTSTSVAPKATADLDVSASFWVQRAVAGDVTVSLIEVGGLGQIGTSRDIAVPVTGSNTYQVVTFSRTRSSADTTPRVYRLSVFGNGSDVTVREGRITVTPKS